MSDCHLTSAEDKMPLSPHLTIYKPQLTSMLSILHRITGFALYVGTIVMVWWLVLVVYDYDFLSEYLLDHPLGLVVVYGWSWMLFYHLLNGIRHLMWDMGHGLEMPCVNKSGIAVVLLSLALTGVCWYIATIMTV